MVRHLCCFFFQAEDGIRDYKVTGVQTCALPICRRGVRSSEAEQAAAQRFPACGPARAAPPNARRGLAALLHRSEEHTSELQSPCNLGCRLLLEKKNLSPVGTVFESLRVFARSVL